MLRRLYYFLLPDLLLVQTTCCVAANREAKQEYEPKLARIVEDLSLPGKVRRHARSALKL